VFRDQACRLLGESALLQMDLVNLIFMKRGYDLLTRSATSTIVEIVDYPKALMAWELYKLTPHFLTYQLGPGPHPAARRFRGDGLGSPSYSRRPAPQCQSRPPHRARLRPKDCGVVRVTGRIRCIRAFRLPPSLDSLEGRRCLSLLPRCFLPSGLAGVL